MDDFESRLFAIAHCALASRLNIVQIVSALSNKNKKFDSE